jgi:hypothetical protein
MGVRNQEIKICYQQLTQTDFTPDIDGAYDILFTETLKDWKPMIEKFKQVQNGYCNVLQSNLN